MASAAFKSSSKRPISTTPSRNNTTHQQRQEKHPNSTHKVVPRRSRSVSASSRTHLDETSDFSNTRDNPLFWVDGFDPRSNSDEFDGVDEKVVHLSILKVVSGDEEGRRSRSVSRNSSSGDRKFAGGVGRSLSWAGSGRQRSLSRGAHGGNYESEKEKGSELPSNLRSGSKTCSNRIYTLPVDTTKLVRSVSDLSEVLKSSKTWSSQHPAYETSDDSAISLSNSLAQRWNDGSSTSTSFEDEERTIKPVSEERKVIHWENLNTGGIVETFRTEVRQTISDMHKDFKDAMRSGAQSNVITSGHFHESTPELGSPDAVRDLRDEFSRELVECEDRARRLRAELAIEELREIELSKILYDMVPEPETPQVQKPRLVRKASTERKKMSKRLEDEAMAYFDECVSISTFDDSDFSSLEDPSLHMVKVHPGGETTYVKGTPTTDSASLYIESQDHLKQSSLRFFNEDSNLAGTCDSYNFAGRHSLINLATSPEYFCKSMLSDPTFLAQDIRNYVKKISSDKEKESNNPHVRTAPQKTSSRIPDMPAEKLLLDRLEFRSRIASGCILLCDLPGTPFSSSFR